MNWQGAGRGLCTSTREASEVRPSSGILIRNLVLAGITTQCASKQASSSQRSKRQLTPDDRKSIAYFQPERIGEVVFNWFD